MGPVSGEAGWHSNRDAVELARRWASINPRVFAASKASHHFAAGLLAGIPLDRLREAVESMKGRKPFEIVDALKPTVAEMKAAVAAEKRKKDRKWLDDLSAELDAKQEAERNAH